MSTWTKNPNSNLAAKLGLRKRFLDDFHAGASFTVFDCCEGPGKMWAYLSQRYDCATWGVDKTPSPGRLQVDSVRILESGASFDVVDIDTYGSPWAHWFALLPHVRRPVTVFLTLGQVVSGTTGQVGKAALGAMGLVFPTLRVSPGLQVKLTAKIPAYCVDAARGQGLRIVRWSEALGDNKNMRYFGVRLEPESWVKGTP